MKKNREILLCDLDAFFASVEQRDNPALRGKPVIIGGNPEGRGVASTCSYEARKYGVHSAMPMKKAITLCPDAIILRGRMSRYKEVSNQVMKIFERFTPEIEPVSIDEAYLAVGKGEGISVGHSIHDAVKKELELPMSVGVSTNKLLAKIACELAKPDKVESLWIDEIKERLWPLPVRTLPGIGPAAERSLHQVGIKNVRDLALYPTGSLKRILGSYAETAHQFAQGLDSRLLEQQHEVKSISEETTFPEDIYQIEIMLSVIYELSEGVGFRLRATGLTARTVSIKLRYQDFRTITRSKTLPETIYSDSDIYQTAGDLFNNNCGKPPWRLIGVQVSGFEEGSQISLFNKLPNKEKEKDLMLTKDHLKRKYGSDIVFQGKRLVQKKDKPDYRKIRE
ncbi:MAG: DNA polymerase IV [Bacillota bacterium]|nr:DNA polymerase IV [Bacillota bacterium]